MLVSYGQTQSGKVPLRYVVWCLMLLQSTTSVCGTASEVGAVPDISSVHGVRRMYDTCVSSVCILCAVLT
jgi:hypothetical protein